VYFVTQNPLDVPDTVLAQLGNRVQHALRAFTPRDQKAVKTAAETMRPNPKFDAAEAIMELGTGEALVSFLDEKGRPSIVERAFVLPPASRLGPLTAQERSELIRGSAVYGRYEEVIDRESAYEKLKGRAAEAAAAAGAPEVKKEEGGGIMGGALGEILFGSTGPRGGRRDGVVQSAAKSAARSVASGLGREIVRGVLGSIFGGRRR